MALIQDVVIEPFDSSLREKLQHKLDHKTKPQGSLGRLEEVAKQLGLIQGTQAPQIKKPVIYIFAGDHGVCDEGVSAYPQAVTAQMVQNFIAGGAAISVLAAQHQLEFFVVDAGVKGELPSDCLKSSAFISRKVVQGTANFALQKAMASQQTQEAVDAGADLIRQSVSQGSNTVILGEMGIGNTTSASAIMHCITGIPIRECVGAGTGLSSDGVEQKASVIARAVARHQDAIKTPFDILAALGGAEIAMMVGAYLAAAAARVVILVDGFIASAALAIAHRINPLVLEYCIFSHGSAELGHAGLLNYFKREPLLSLSLRLGEGSGAALAYPLVQSAALILSDMASFEEASVSGKEVSG